MKLQLTIEIDMLSSEEDFIEWWDNELRKERIVELIHTPSKILISNNVKINELKWKK